MRNIKIELMYDGTSYHGFQIQKNGLTIQQCLEDAVFKITNERASIIGCSRTVAGVHAKGYVANFYTNTKVPTEKIPIALNSFLNSDIRVKNAEDVSEEFHARKSAVSKTYNYKIVNQKYEDVFLRNFSWFYPKDLNFEKMREASKYFIGEHDFKGFMATGSSVKTTVRNIISLDIYKNDSIIDIEISANGFLYNMVRIIAGTLVYVGNGKINIEDIPDILRSKDRKKAGITAPPSGLTLLKVKY